VGKLLFTSSSFLPPPPLLQTLRLSELLHSPCAQAVDARQAPCAEEQDGESQTANSATSWVPFVFQQKDLDKAYADGLISADD
jgi:hypothetical protein